MTGGWLLFGAWLALAPAANAAVPEAPAQAPASRLTLRNGTVYLLREPPRVSGSRVVFTTMDGRLYSMDQSEIESIGAPRPTRTPRPYYSTEDSRALGALARRDREARGLKAEVSPRRAPAARKRGPAKKRTRKPTPRTTPRAS